MEIKAMKVVPLKMDVSWQLLNAIRIGERKTIQDVLVCYNLSYSSAWAEGYVLLLTALEKNHKDIARMLLLRGAKVNSNNKRHTNTPLHYAAKIGDLELVEMILQRGGKVNARNAVGETPIHIATKLGHLEIVRLFLNHSAYIGPRYVSSSEKYTPLHLSVKEGYEDITELLLAHHADINAKTSNGQTPLYIASMMGFSQIVKILINHRPDINSAMDNGHTPLHVACENHNVDVIKLLLNNDIEINQTAYGGIMPLHIATEKGYENIIKLLLAHGAKGNIQDSKGHNALHYALIQTANGKKYERIANTFLEYGFSVDSIDVKDPKLFHAVITKGYLQVVKNFLELGANFNVKNYLATKPKGDKLKGADVNVQLLEIPLHVAITNKHVEIVKLFLEFGAEIDDLDNHGRTALHIACQMYECEEIIKILLGYGSELLLVHQADINAKTSKGETPLYIASMKGLAQIVKILLNHGADINSAIKNGYTPLHVACKNGSVDVIKLLLNHGVKINQTSDGGITPLHIATKKGSENIVKLLLAHGANGNIPDSKGHNALHYALIQTVDEKKYERIANTFLEYGFSVDPIDVKDPKLFHDVITKGYLQFVKNFLELGANVNVKKVSNAYITEELADMPLQNAVKHKHKEIVTLLLKHGASVNAKDSTGISAIFYAIMNADGEITKLLLSSGASTDNEYDLLESAIKVGSKEIIEILLDHGVNINATGSSRDTALHFTIHTIDSLQSSCKELIETLLEHGANINATNISGKTALHCTIQRRLLSNSTYRGIQNSEINKVKLEIVDLLLQKGIDVNIQTNLGMTALHQAVALGKVEMVRKLLEYNADVNSTSLQRNLTVLHLAAQQGDKLINRMLLEKGANVNVQLLETPLHVATRKKHVEIFKLFLEFGAEIDHLDKCGRTALHIACLYECEEIIKILLGYGSELRLVHQADINAKTSKGETPLYIASMKGLSQIVKILLNHRADINSAIKNGYTPLHVACENGSVDVIKLLLNNEIKINQTSDGGITPLHIATEKGSENTVKLLLAHGANGNISDTKGHNALHYALIQTVNEKKYERIANTFLQYGFSVDPIDVKDPKLFHDVITKGYLQVVKNFLELGANFNVKNYLATKPKGDKLKGADVNVQLSEIPLHVAIRNKHVEIVKLFLEFGAEIDDLDNRGRTALHIACQMYDECAEIIKILLGYGSDVNIVDATNRTPFSYIQDRTIKEYIKQYVITMRAANLYINLRNLPPFLRTGEINNSLCIQELESLKAEKIGNSKISFHDFLTRSPHQLVVFTRNENIVDILESYHYEAKFPLYADIIRGRFRKAMVRRKLLDQGHGCLNVLFKNLLPYNCLEIILNFLKNNDIRNFITTKLEV